MTVAAFVNKKKKKKKRFNSFSFGPSRLLPISSLFALPLLSLMSFHFFPSLSLTYSLTPARRDHSTIESPYTQYNIPIYIYTQLLYNAPKCRYQATNKVSEIYTPVCVAAGSRENRVESEILSCCAAEG